MWRGGREHRRGEKDGEAENKNWPGWREERQGGRAGGGVGSNSRRDGRDEA